MQAELSQAELMHEGLFGWLYVLSLTEKRLCLVARMSIRYITKKLTFLPNNLGWKYFYKLVHHRIRILVNFFYNF